MTQRITIKHLRHCVDCLNDATDSPRDYMRLSDEGERETCIGHYCLDGAYGGWQLQRVMTTGGGVRTISSGGHISARALLDQIQCALNMVREIERGGK